MSLTVSYATSTLTEGACCPLHVFRLADPLSCSASLQGVGASDLRVGQRLPRTVRKVASLPVGRLPRVRSPPLPRPLGQRVGLRLPTGVASAMVLVVPHGPLHLPRGVRAEASAGAAGFALRPLPQLRMSLARPVVVWHVDFDSSSPSPLPACSSSEQKKCEVRRGPPFPLSHKSLSLSHKSLSLQRDHLPAEEVGRREEEGVMSACRYDGMGGERERVRSQWLSSPLGFSVSESGDGEP